MKLLAAPLRDLIIDDDRDLQHVEIYRDLKEVMAREARAFRVPAKGGCLPWSRALFLNLTWRSEATPSDVLSDRRIPADALAHAAWLRLSRRALADGPPNADVMFMGEAIASAFDLYLVGRVLNVVMEAELAAAQVPAMTDVAIEAGATEAEVEEMFASVVDDPERAFEDLRALLFDVCASLVHARDVDDASERLDVFSRRRFAPLLHHYEVSKWILLARADAPEGLSPDPRVRALHAELSAAPSSVDLLHQRWVTPRLRA